MSNNEMYKLNGYLAGQDKPFIVAIAPNDLVIELKDKIHAKLKLTCAASDLKIYKLDRNKITISGPQTETAGRTPTESMEGSYQQVKEEGVEIVSQDQLLQNAMPDEWEKQQQYQFFLQDPWSIDECWKTLPMSKRRIHFMVVLPDGAGSSALPKPILTLYDLLDPGKTQLPSRDSMENLGRLEGCQNFMELERHIPFVGHANNITSLKEALEKQYCVQRETHGTKHRPLLDKEIALICCTGPSGVGKTCFVCHAVQHIIDNASMTDDLVECLGVANKSNLNIHLDPSTWTMKAVNCHSIARLVQMQLLFEICKYHDNFKTQSPNFQKFWDLNYTIASTLQLDSWLFLSSGESDHACIVVHFNETNALLAHDSLDGKQIVQALFAQIKNFWRKPQCQIFPILICSGTLSHALYNTCVPRRMNPFQIVEERLIQDTDT
ncbi:hypothetical protein E4T56_gene11152 [Termitomyces sp. T112]|nr:hypothetical protein E4T56_gene11152 [Termitomyces sp. T112]